MSNHFTGLSLGPPLDQRLEAVRPLCIPVARRQEQNRYHSERESHR
jgi:hypothetical protein